MPEPRERGDERTSAPKPNLAEDKVRSGLDHISRDSGTRVDRNADRNATPAQRLGVERVYKINVLPGTPTRATRPDVLSPAVSQAPKTGALVDIEKALGTATSIANHVRQAATGDKTLGEKLEGEAKEVLLREAARRIVEVLAPGTLPILELERYGEIAVRMYNIATFPDKLRSMAEGVSLLREDFDVKAFHDAQTFSESYPRP